MKKNVLALSISAAVLALGAAGSAHAITTVVPGAAAKLAVNPAGIGHNLIVPYFTAQGDNATLINLVNTDSTNGKAVKVRFRGAANSDDVLDFQVFMSPSDVWTAKISKSADGAAMITTADTTCTLPVNSVFSGKSFLTGRLASATDVNGTREGYIEIFNMANVTGALLTGITHVNGKPKDCGVLSALSNDAASWPGLTNPTTGLMANWTIINTVTAAAYGGAAIAVDAIDVNGKAATGNLVYWPQNETPVKGDTTPFTADPLLAGDLTLGSTQTLKPAIKALNQDLPDMSTPYAGSVGQVYVASSSTPSSAMRYATELSGALAATSVANEFFTDSAALQIGAATDWVFTMPTRRYHVALSYPSTRVYTPYSIANTYFAASNTAVVANVASGLNQICVDGIKVNGYDREEYMQSGATFSPSATQYFCGEVGVWSINKTISAAGDVSAVLGANVSVVGVTPQTPIISEGWMSVATPGLAVAGESKGLPVLGSSFTKASSDAAKNYGVNTDHRYFRP